MNDDYPAAHSMDTDWFAVDVDGNVAILRSGEDGLLPLEWEKVRVNEGGYDGFNLIEDVEKFLGKKAPVEIWEPKVEALGLFCYDHSLFPEYLENSDGDAITPYERIAVPDEPLNVSDLPADISRKVSLIRFDRINFKTAPRLQPMLDMKCISYSEYQYYYDESLEIREVEENQLVMPGEVLQYYKAEGREKSVPWWKRLLGLE